MGRVLHWERRDGRGCGSPPLGSCPAAWAAAHWQTRRGGAPRLGPFLLLLLLCGTYPSAGLPREGRGSGGRGGRGRRGRGGGALGAGGGKGGDQAALNLTADSILGSGPAESARCLERREAERRATEEAQRRIHRAQHPADCSAAPLLLCLGDLPNSRFAGSTLGAAEKGLGVRVMYYGRCITRAMMLGRAAVLEGAAEGRELLRLFKPWGSCSLADVDRARRDGPAGRVVEFDPSYDAPIKAAGTRDGTHLMPRAYARRGVLWWKAQELHYLLRPTDELTGLVRRRAAELAGGGGYAGVHKRAFGWRPKGCSEAAGECFVPGRAFPVADYVSELRRLRPFDKDRPVVLASDGLELAVEIRDAEGRYGVRVVQASTAPGGDGPPGGRYAYGRDEARRAATDLLLLAGSHPLALTWTSYFGVVAAMLKMVRDGFCSSWVSLEHPTLVPRRAFIHLWPNPGHLAQGGLCYLQTARGHIEDLQGAGDPRGMHCVLAGPWDARTARARRVSLDCRC